MLDFTPVREKQLTTQDLASTMSVADLRAHLNAQVDHILGLLGTCTDADVVFQPVDPDANDPAAATSDELSIAWTLGHVIVHLTASYEESAALAAEMARGIAFHGRSRSEVHWTTVTTIEQLRHRMEESRRMCLGALDMWPDSPHLDLLQEAWPGGPVIDARGRFLLGLSHADSHIGQIREIIRQAHA